VNAIAQSAVGARNHVLSSNNSGKILDAPGNQLWMLDQVCGVADDTRYKNLAVGNFNVAPDRPLVFMAYVASFETDALRLNLKNEVNHLLKGKIVSMRAVPTAPTDVKSCFVFWNAFQSLVESIDPMLH